MKKKLLALLLALTMTLSLAACGGNKNEQKPENDGQQAETVTPPADETEDAGDDADDTTDEPAEGETDEVAETNPETAPEEQPVTSKPIEKPAEKPAQEPNKPAEKPETPAKPQVKPEEPVAPAADGVDLTAFFETQTANGVWPAMMPLEGEMLDTFYAGLSGIAAKQCLVNMAVITAAVGEVALVEVENAADVQAVKDIFQARVSYQVGDETNPGGAWYPGSIEGWKNNSRIVSNGSFVMLVVSDSADTVVEAFNALFA